jgi:hypothetical protein
VGLTPKKPWSVRAAIASSLPEVLAHPSVLQNHATMENHERQRATERCEVWTPNGEAALAVRAEAAGLPPADVHKVHSKASHRRGATDHYVYAKPGDKENARRARQDDLVA